MTVTEKHLDMPEHIERPNTICAACRYLHKKGDIWYDLFCKHPTLKNAPAIEPLLGKQQFKTASGSFTDQQYPYAKDINFGDCEYFERRYDEVV